MYDAPCFKYRLFILFGFAPAIIFRWAKEGDCDGLMMIVMMVTIMVKFIVVMDGLMVIYVMVVVVVHDCIYCSPHLFCFVAN